MVSPEVKSYLAAIGRKGGKVRTHKGLACLSDSKRREISKKGVLARLKKK